MGINVSAMPMTIILSIYAKRTKAMLVNASTRLSLTSTELTFGARQETLGEADIQLPTCGTPGNRTICII
jgi:hypothetical protein